jgi:E3 ubiquitin-protein ligase TRIP12
VLTNFCEGEYLTLILQPGGRDLQVTSTNVDEYVLEVLDAIIGKGASLQAQTFREGFSKVFPIQDLQAFSADELMLLFGNSDEDWSNESAQLFVLAKGAII